MYHVKALNVQMSHVGALNVQKTQVMDLMSHVKALNVLISHVKALNVSMSHVKGLNVLMFHVKAPNVQNLNVLGMSGADGLIVTAEKHRNATRSEFEPVTVLTDVMVMKLNMNHVSVQNVMSKALPLNVRLRSLMNQD